ncbi:MAG TPA: hypothetical protein VFS37_16235 [Conexibacter sp.]|nr:hypothetical protein [Conexibacter sp.]
MIPLVLLILLASELPDPGMPHFVPLMGTLGLFVGGLAAHLRGIPAEERSRCTGTGTWAGIGVGGAVWIAVHVIDRL